MLSITSGHEPSGSVSASMTCRSPVNPIDGFKNAIASAGMEPPAEVHGDGRIHRFSPTGKRSDDAGWYVLHLDDVPAGSFRQLARRLFAMLELQGRTCHVGHRAQSPGQAHRRHAPSA